MASTAAEAAVSESLFMFEELCVREAEEEEEVVEGADGGGG